MLSKALSAAEVSWDDIRLASRPPLGPRVNVCVLKTQETQRLGGGRPPRVAPRPHGDCGSARLHGQHRPGIREHCCRRSLRLR